MLHSSLGSKAQWTALAERMARRYRVIALDLCGYGDNAGVDPGTPFTLDDEVRLIAARLDKLVEPHLRVHVVGHSWRARRNAVRAK
jgi:pimeloyl-ACP methyl ester carboxylesterase